MDVNDGPADYCRQVEAYLCRKNGGHLVRIVGPAFEQVCGWAARGIPLAVAYRGVDRHCDRYAARRDRRRPVRIEFCEADVLDAFDEWRRSVGIAAADASSTPDEQVGAARRTRSLPVHLEGAVARLTPLRASGSLGRMIDDVIRELDAARAAAKTLRGDARHDFLERLHALDAQLLEAARADADGAGLEDLGRAADEELAPFRDRMPPDAYAQSRRACIDRLLRERARLPVLGYD